MQGQPRRAWSLVVVGAALVAGCDGTTPTGSTFVTASTQPNASYDYSVVDAPGATATWVYRMSARGELVGTYTDNAGTHGFVMRGGNFERVDFPGATATQVRSMNGQGDIVGFYSLGGKLHGFARSAGHLTTIDVPAAAGTRLWDVNAAGDIAGEYLGSGGQWRAFVRRAGEFNYIDVPGATMSAAYGINDEGEVVGHYTVPGSPKMFGYSMNSASFKQFDHPASGNLMSCAQGIGALGRVVGHYQDAASGIVFGYLWDRDSFADTLRVPGARATYALSIISNGSIAGYFVDGAGATHGFVAKSLPRCDTRPWAEEGQACP